MAEVRMPKLGESVTEGTLGKWFKNVGDQVGKYEPLVEVITDKVNAEIPSDYVGVLQAILVRENETVRVGTPIAIITVVGEEPDDTASSRQEQVAHEASPAPETIAAKQESAVDQHAQQPKGPSADRFSPAVLQIASERGIDLSLVQGTGLGGRVTRKDVLSYATSGQEAENGRFAAAQEGVATPRVHEGQPANEEWVALTPVRKTIAKRMVDSKHQAPHAWMMVEVDATALVRLREKQKAAFKQREGIDLTYLPFFIKAAVEALKAFPIVNSVWADDKIIVKKDIHISLAVATEAALVVPVIHHADQFSILGLAQAIGDLAKRARAGKLTLADVQGGTFTLNNTGAFGSVLSQPIINAPQAAILSVEAIVRRPIVQKDDSIAVRSMVNLCVSLDHRVLDGWVVGQFMRAVKQHIENISEQTNLF